MVGRFGYTDGMNKSIKFVCSSVVFVPFVSAFTFVEDSGALVRAAQLLCVVANLLPTTLTTRLIDDGMSLHIVLGDGLHLGALRTQGRGERSRLRMGYDNLGRCVFALRTTYTAGQNSILFASAAV